MCHYLILLLSGRNRSSCRHLFPSKTKEGILWTKATSVRLPARSSKCAMHCCWKWRRARRCQNIRPQQNGERSTVTTIRLSTVLNQISEIARSYVTERMKILKVCSQYYERLIKEIDKNCKMAERKASPHFPWSVLAWSCLQRVLRTPWQLRFVRRIF